MQIVQVVRVLVRMSFCLCVSGSYSAYALSSPDNPNVRVESQLSAAEQEAAAINRSLYNLSQQPGAGPAETVNWSTDRTVWADMTQHFLLAADMNRPSVQHWLNWYRAHPQIVNFIFNNARPYLY